MPSALLLAHLGSALAAFHGDPVPDTELSAMRGGMLLPNGIDIAMTVQTQTSLNGAIVLASVFSVDQGPAQLSVYAPRAGEVVAAPSAPGDQAAGPPGIIVNAGGGVSITPGAVSIPVTIGSGGTGGLAAGLAPVTAGQPAQTDNGTITTGALGNNLLVTLAGADFDISHFAGGAFGSAIVNNGSDRTFDTVTTLSIDLRGAGPDVLGSTMFQVENLGLDALASRW